MRFLRFICIDVSSSSSPGQYSPVNLLLLDMQSSFPKEGVCYLVVKDEREEVTRP